MENDYKAQTPPQDMEISICLNETNLQNIPQSLTYGLYEQELLQSQAWVEGVLKGIEWFKSLGPQDFGLNTLWYFFWKIFRKPFWKSFWWWLVVGLDVTSLLVLFLVFWPLYWCWKVVGWWVGGCIWIIASALGPCLVKSQMSSARLGQPWSRPRPRSLTI